MTDKGKKIENECQEHFKDKDIWLHRFYDYRSGVRVPQPADYLIIKKNPEFIECKETEDFRLDISDFQPSQLKAMKRAKQKKLNYTVIILIKKKFYYSLDSSEILETINNGQKSISLKNRSYSNKFSDLYK